jgi:hypothetical protein
MLKRNNLVPAHSMVLLKATLLIVAVVGWQKKLRIDLFFVFSFGLLVGVSTISTAPSLHITSRCPGCGSGMLGRDVPPHLILARIPRRSK